MPEMASWAFGRQKFVVGASRPYVIVPPDFGFPPPLFSGALGTTACFAMPPAPRDVHPPKVLVEWWPKPVIAPARHSWATDLIALAGGVNPWQRVDAKSTPLTDAQVFEAPVNHLEIVSRFQEYNPALLAAIAAVGGRGTDAKAA